MAARHFRVLGQTLIYPKGLRKSPGMNNRSRCMAIELTGKSGIAGFIKASDACKVGGGGKKQGSKARPRLYKVSRGSRNFGPLSLT